MDSGVHAGAFHGRKDGTKEMGHHRVTEVQMEHRWHLDQCCDQANAEGCTYQLGTPLPAHQDWTSLGPVLS